MEEAEEYLGSIIAKKQQRSQERSSTTKNSFAFKAVPRDRTADEVGKKRQTLAPSPVRYQPRYESSSRRSLLAMNFAKYHAVDIQLVEPPLERHDYQDGVRGCQKHHQKHCEFDIRKRVKLQQQRQQQRSSEKARRRRVSTDIDVPSPPTRHPTLHQPGKEEIIEERSQELNEHSLAQEYGAANDQQAAID